MKEKATIISERIPKQNIWEIKKMSNYLESFIKHKIQAQFKINLIEC